MHETLPLLSAGVTVISSLEEINWRLMREGINYRLGILTDRFKAYEREEDLIKIVHL